MNTPDQDHIDKVILWISYAEDDLGLAQFAMKMPGNRPYRLIINSPYDEPVHHWSYDRETRSFSLKDGRRPAGYVVASQSSKAFDDPGVTGITKRLLEHWRNPEERDHRRFFFCQLETKGQETQQDRTKRGFLEEWVKAVNQHGRFGTWHWAVSKNPADVSIILEKEANTKVIREEIWRTKE